MLADSPLAGIVSSTKVDHDGKTLAVVPAGNLSGEQSDEWFEHKFAQADSVRRSIFIAGQFEPVRHHLSSRFAFSQRHFLVIAQQSPFVPIGHESIFALGFARLFQGDFISATHLLIPQLENSVREVLKNSGEDPTIIQSDMAQEDRSLSAMLDGDREKIDAIFGPDLALEIDLLFNSRLGPSLRHEMAHGKIHTNECTGSDAIYACWLIFHVTCLPLGAYWPDISRAIEVDEF